MMERLIEENDLMTTKLVVAFKGWELTYERGNDWGERPYEEKERYDTFEGVQAAIINKNYYDTIIDVKEVTTYDVKYIDSEEVLEERMNFLKEYL